MVAQEENWEDHQSVRFIYPTAAGVFQSGPKRWTDWQMNIGVYKTTALAQRQHWVCDKQPITNLFLQTRLKFCYWLLCCVAVHVKSRRCDSNRWDSNRQWAETCLSNREGEICVFVQIERFWQQRPAPKATLSHLKTALIIGRYVPHRASITATLHLINTAFNSQRSARKLVLTYVNMIFEWHS